MIDIVIPTIPDRAEKLGKLLESIPKTKDINIIIVDEPGLSLAAKRNKGAAAGNNDLILFIDDDNYLHPNALRNIIKVFNNESVAIVGMIACYSKDKIRIADGGSKRYLLPGFSKGLYTNQILWDILKKPSYEVDEVANAFIVRREIFWNFGGFDEKTFPTELDEADFCRVVKKYKYKILMCPTAVVYHDSQTYSIWPDFRRPKNAYYMGRNRILFQRKYLSWLSFKIYTLLFLPIFIGFYVISLVFKNRRMIKYFLEGVIDGIRNRKTNKY
jgi:GT2 family glycosyltransferase